MTIEIGGKLIISQILMVDENDRVDNSLQLVAQVLADEGGNQPLENDDDAKKKLQEAAKEILDRKTTYKRVIKDMIGSVSFDEDNLPVALCKLIITFDRAGLSENHFYDQIAGDNNRTATDSFFRVAFNHSFKGDSRNLDWESPDDGVPGKVLEALKKDWRLQGQGITEKIQGEEKTPSSEDFFITTCWSTGDYKGVLEYIENLPDAAKVFNRVSQAKVFDVIEQAPVEDKMKLLAVISSIGDGGFCSKLAGDPSIAEYAKKATENLKNLLGRTEWLRSLKNQKVADDEYRKSKISDSAIDAAIREGRAKNVSKDETKGQLMRQVDEYASGVLANALVPTLWQRTFPEKGLSQVLQDLRTSVMAGNGVPSTKGHSSEPNAFKAYEDADRNPKDNSMSSRVKLPKEHLSEDLPFITHDMVKNGEIGPTFIFKLLNPGMQIESHITQLIFEKAIAGEFNGEVRAKYEKFVTGIFRALTYLQVVGQTDEELLKNLGKEVGLVVLSNQGESYVRTCKDNFLGRLKDLHPNFSRLKKENQPVVTKDFYDFIQSVTADVNDPSVADRAAIREIAELVKKMKSNLETERGNKYDAKYGEIKKEEEAAEKAKKQAELAKLGIEMVELQKEIGALEKTSLELPERIKATEKATIKGRFFNTDAPTKEMREVAVADLRSLKVSTDAELKEKGEALVKLDQKIRELEKSLE